MGITPVLKKRKICIVGDFAVGKTSLTQKFVNNVFSDKYLTTIGVKIDSVVVKQTKLIIWDVAGRDSLTPIKTNYLVGATGIVLVADGTRSGTVAALETIWQTTEDRIGNVPVVVALNKCDHSQWGVTKKQIEFMHKNRWATFETSAKDGSNVQALFMHLAGLLE